ncbi:MAG TPA: hypothetical protein VF068_06480, partial [Rubrobacter sp.]
ELEETIRSFKEVVEGKHDDLPEQAFYLVGGIDEAVEKARKLGGEEDEESEDEESEDESGQAEASSEDSDEGSGDEESAEDGEDDEK